MVVRVGLIFCVVAGVSVSAARAEDKPLMTRKGIEETCATIEKSPAADLVTKRKANELAKLLRWEYTDANSAWSYFDSLEKMDDGKYLVRVNKSDNRGTEAIRDKYDEIEPQRQEQLKYAWKLLGELSPIAEKIRAGGMPSLETTKVKIIDSNQVCVDTTTVLDTIFAKELTDVETRNKARKLDSFGSKEWGSYGKACIEAILTNNDGSEWVELYQYHLKDGQELRRDTFVKRTMARYTDLDPESQQRYREYRALSDEIASVAARIRAEKARRLAATAEPVRKATAKVNGEDSRVTANISGGEVKPSKRACAEAFVAKYGNYFITGDAGIYTAGWFLKEAKTRLSKGDERSSRAKREQEGRLEARRSGVRGDWSAAEAKNSLAAYKSGKLHVTEDAFLDESAKEIDKLMEGYFTICKLAELEPKGLLEADEIRKAFEE